VVPLDHLLGLEFEEQRGALAGDIELRRFFQVKENLARCIGAQAAAAGFAEHLPQRIAQAGWTHRVEVVVPGVADMDLADFWHR